MKRYSMQAAADSGADRAEGATRTEKERARGRATQLAGQQMIKCHYSIYLNLLIH